MRFSELPQPLREWVDRACDSFEAAWRSEPKPRIEDALRDAPDRVQPALLEELLKIELEARERRGERPQPEEYRGRFPDHAALINRLVDREPGRSVFAEPADPPGAGPAPEVKSDPDPPNGRAVGQEHAAGFDPAAILARAGDDAWLDEQFRIVRPHAEGGLGEVLLARGEVLDREVALKRIQGSHADDPGSRSRFLREAEITGRLQHPGIIQIYGLGRFADGRPFYVMPFVRGRCLRDAILEHHAEHPDPDPRTGGSRALLQRFVAVCDAIAYAHSRGVLHRDLKPHNILIGEFGETLIIDWGLAKAIDEPHRKDGDGMAGSGSPCDGDLAPTVTGEALGTPRYMSPEQARGEHQALGPATDIYSLGAVLYQILTGRAPGPGQDPARAEQPAAGGAFRRPRAVNRNVPRALEAVCLKALATRPEDRYATAAALRADVERWLADEPVSARREPWAERAARWGRRHRSAAAVSVLALAAIAAAAVVTTGVVSLAREGERRALARAEARAALAIASVRRYRDTVENNLDVRNRPDLAGLRTSLLAEPVGFFRALRRELLEGRDSGPATTFQLGGASLELAVLLEAIGSKPDAVRAYHEAIATLEPLPRRIGPRDPTGRDARLLLADALSRLGLLRRDLGQVQDARANLGEAVRVAGRLARDHPSPAVRRMLARALDRLAVFEGPEHPEVALPLLERAIALLRPPGGDRGIVPDDPDALAFVSMHLATALKALNRSRDAAGRLQESIAAFEGLVRQSPRNQHYRGNLASAYYNLGNLQLQGATNGQCRASFQRARDLWEGLVREAPTASNHRLALVRAYGTLGVLHEKANELPEARAALERARDLGEVLVRDHPERLPDRAALGRTYVNLAVLERKLGHLDRTVELLRPGRECLRVVFEARRGDPSARDALATACGNLGEALEDIGHDTEALEAFRACADLELDPARANDPHVPIDHTILRTGLLGTARCLRRLGDVEGAVKAVERLRALGPAEPAELAQVAGELASCSAAATDRAEARRYADAAMDLLRAAIAAGYRDLQAVLEEPGFAPLRGRRDFADLLADAPFPANPFAHR
jgi:serine/threonine-protein kinase